MFEYEKKVLLTEKEYNILKKTAREDLPVHQINYYYDTDDLKMHRQGITCRIREKNNICVATIKEHHSGSRECSTETSKTATDPSDTSLFPEPDIKLQGQLITERIFLMRENDISVMLDRNLYHNIVDYELEIEYAPHAEKQAEHVLIYFAEILRSEFTDFDKELFLKRSSSPKSKSERFFMVQSAMKNRKDDQN